MLTIFIRSIIVYILLIIVMRLMGKRQLSELQPFEFAITLIIAELASSPMAETTIPLMYGVIPIFTLFIVHLFINKISSKSIKFRKVMNGSPMIVMTPAGIDTRILAKLDMNVNDLMDSLRASGFFNPSDVQYAILETNGQLSVLSTSSAKTVTAADLGITTKETNLPRILVSEGKIMDNAINITQITCEEVIDILGQYSLTLKDIFLMTVNGDIDYYIQPYKGKAIKTKLMEH